MIIAIFKHIFELRWGLQNALHILVCHSVTSWWNPYYHTPISRGYPDVSYGPNSLNISGVIRELELGETFRWIPPRTCHQCDLTFSRKYLPKHIKSVHEKVRVQCTVCEVQLSNKAQLTYHLKAKHGNGDSEKVGCDMCDKTFTCKGSLLRHKKKKHPTDAG